MKEAALKRLHTPHDPAYVTFSNRENHSDGEQIYGFWEVGLGEVCDYKGGGQARFWG